MKNIKSIVTCISLLIAAIIFTLLVHFVDVKSTGLLDSSIGLAKFNIGFRDAVGYNDTLAKISKYFIVIPFGIMLFYVVLAVIELVRNKSVKKVDLSYYLLFISFVAIVLVYVLFEVVIINYRPILEDGILKASFPSSHTLLAVSICGMAVIMNSLLEKREVFFFNRKGAKLNLNCIFIAFSILAVVTRLFSGVHWLTDIMGGILYGAFLISFFNALVKNFLN